MTAQVIESVSKTGGHLSSSLGVTELTVALHYVFNAPDDKIVWDVAHQAYPHKMITGSGPAPTAVVASATGTPCRVRNL